MDFNTIVTAGVLGFGLVNVLALASVLVLTRPGRYRTVQITGWEARTAPDPYIEAGQPDTAALPA